MCRAQDGGLPLPPQHTARQPFLGRRLQPYPGQPAHGYQQATGYPAPYPDAVGVPAWPRQLLPAHPAR
eukprot:10783824-Alexandrium_andersonii.AAC.1